MKNMGCTNSKCAVPSFLVYYEYVCFLCLYGYKSNDTKLNLNFCKVLNL